MALTISQVTDFWQIVPTVTTVDLGFRTGYHVSNATRAGEGMVVIFTGATFGEEQGTASFNILVFSGSFQAGDTLNFSPGGSCVINTATSVAHPGILTTGTMTDTDSGYNTNAALDATETDITIQSNTVILPGMILRIEDTVDEYVVVDIKVSATVYTCRRGLYGTGGTHTTGKNVHIVDTDLFEQIFDADVSGGWGYSTCTNGRLEFDCHLLHGRTDQTAENILISANENIDSSATATNAIRVFGNATYKTYAQYGVGYLSDTTGDWDGFAAYSSILKAGKDIQNCYGSKTYYFRTSMNSIFVPRGATFAYSITCNSSLTIVTEEASRFYNTALNFAPILVASSNNDIKILNVYGESIYWVTTSADMTAREIVTDARVGDGGFLCSGTKTLIDCKCASYVNIFVGHGTIFDNYKSFNCNVVDEKGNPIEGVTVVCKWRGNSVSTDTVFTTTTDASGDIAEQLVKFMYATLTGSGFTMSTLTTYSYRDIEYFIQKSGYKTIRGRKTIADRDDPIVLKKVLNKNKFRETKSRGGI